MQLFYAPDIAVEQSLSEEESRHAVRVLRVKVNDEINIVDGIGGLYKAVVTNPNPKRCEFEITDTIQNFARKNYRLHIAIAPTKNIERFEWFVEKSTEFGIDEITPILCRYSERKQLKVERLKKIIISAAKQSLQANFPKINPLETFEAFLSRQTDHPCFIAHCYEGAKPLLSSVYQIGDDCTLLIGPEGDFSQDEVESAIKSDYQPISLGHSRLRTETAGIAACHTIVMLNQ
ncbi:MAG: 16S rRNA (uracil(1498)-N(3))-methyltransferase [Paludibacteraceae bacterium]